MSKKSLPTLRTVEEMCALSREQIETDLRTVLERLVIVSEKRERFARKLQVTTDEETRLTLQAQMISLALRLHQNAAAGNPSAAETLQANIAAAPRRREQTLSANVLSIVQQGQGAPVTPRQVSNRLTELGMERDERVIRTALRRWAERGMIVKDGLVYRGLLAR